jgi:hypothetical protein
LKISLSLKFTPQKARIATGSVAASPFFPDLWTTDGPIGVQNHIAIDLDEIAEIVSPELG